MMQERAHRPWNGWRAGPLWIGLTFPVAAAGILILLLFLFVGAASRPVDAARLALNSALPQAPIVTLVKSAGPSLVAPEQILVYTLTVTNTSPTSSTVSLLVTDTVPANTTYQSANFLYPDGGGEWIPPVGGTGVITWIPDAQLTPSGYLQLQLVVKVAAGLSNGTIITNAAYGVSEQSGVVMGVPVTVTVVAPFVSSVSLVASPASVAVAHTSMLTATVLDQDSQPMAGQVVNFSTTDPLGLGGIIPSSTATGSGGQATAVISSTQPGVKRVTATAGSQSATMPVTFTVEPGQPYTVTLTIVPGTLLITQTAHLLATVTDQDGHPLSGQVITFSSPSDFGTLLFSAIVPLTGTTDVNGQVTAIVSSLLGGDKLIIATASNGVTGMAHVSFQGAYRLFLPAAFNAYHAPATCAPQALYDFSSSGFGAMGVAYDAARNRLFIANRDGPDGGSLAVVNPDSGVATRVVTGLLSAQGVAFDASRNLIYVVGWDWLNVVDGATYSVTTSVRLGIGMEAYAVAYNPAKDKLYVSGFSNNTIVIVNAATMSILRTLVDSHTFPIHWPSYIAVNPANDKVYVANHEGGPTGWVTIIDGTTDQIIKTLNPAPDENHGGDLYGIAADGVHNRVYVASISAALVYAIDGASDTTLGAIKIVRAANPPDKPVPLRMVAVNPDIGGTTHLWLTSASNDLFGLDRLIVLALDSWPPMPPMPMATVVAPSPMYGMTLDPTSGKVFVSNFDSNLVTVSQDMATLCSTPLSLRAANADSDPVGWTVIVEDYGSPPGGYGSKPRVR
jgi:uncharacterized repeat protein (TIGR01451 family)